MADKVRADGVSYFQFSNDEGEWIVFPLRGHIVTIDYPDARGDWASTNFEALINANPIRRESPYALHAALRRLADTVDEVILATDYDREGELIGVEALGTVRDRRPDLPAKRARFSAMTPSEIRRAFQDLTDPDWRLAEAAAARQRIDLAWGAVLTRFLTVRCGSARQVLSAGRVQTPTLAIVADRERERDDFVPRTFWNVVLSAGDPPIEATGAGGPYWEEAGAKAIVALARMSGDAIVERVAAREEREAPPAPFNTTSFLAQASRDGFSASRAMAIAQDLYVRGEISYPRTDNTVYPASLNARDILERHRESPYREAVERILAHASLVPTRGPIHTTDHPPIHPTTAPAKRRPGGRAHIHDAIVRRFLATFSPPCEWQVTEVLLRVGDTHFRAIGREIVSEGWRSVLPDANGTSPLPPLHVGQSLPIRGLRLVEGRTRPPPLHTQGSLLITMEHLGLGTKSTRHEILDLLFRRQYVSGRGMRTSASGRALIEALELYGPDVASPAMTGRLEGRMTDIAGGRATLDEVLMESRSDLRAVLHELMANEASLARWLRDATFLENDFGPCDACGEGRLVRRRASNGWAFLGCSRFPSCRRRMRLGPAGHRVPWDVERESLGRKASDPAPA
jgi:DNA topoisomerase-1